MSLTAASGFVFFLLTVQVGQTQDGWRVTYPKPQICAVKRSTVTIGCSYEYPYGRVTENIWFTKGSDTEPVDLRTDADKWRRVEYSKRNNDCKLTIRDVRESDSGEYKFRFLTNQYNGRYTGSPGVTLSVTGPDFQVNVRYQNSVLTKLECTSSCFLPDHPSYIWYKNGEKMYGQRFSKYHFVTIDSVDSYSCAIQGHEDSPSPLVCVLRQTCNRVTYTTRSICAPRGSSVDISCSYHSVHLHIASKFWFRNHQYHYTQPSQDLHEDSQYAGRVQIFETGAENSTLRITDLRESDSAQYRFKFKTNSFEWRSSLPGTTLTVTALQVQVIRTLAQDQYYTEAELRCHSSCVPAGRLSYVWFKNRQEVISQDTFSYTDWFFLGDNISCAFRGHENYRSPSVYAPQVPLASASPSDEITEGSSVTLTCSSDANPAANYTWYKRDVNPNPQSVSKGPQLVFSSIMSSESGEYYCTAENELGRRTSGNLTINVKYPPRRSSVSVNSSEIVEGSSVAMTCSSEANPEANNTWYKENQTLPLSPGKMYHFRSISPEDSGSYYCTSENKYGQINSSTQVINVLYAPRLPSVSVSPSGQIAEGSSVTLTCSSDANPAAHYTWYKEDEDSPITAGQNLTIAEFRNEYSGSYYCKAKNNRGHRTSVFHPIAVASSMKTVAAVSITIVFLAVLLFAAFLFMRRKRSSKKPSVIRQVRPDDKAQFDTGGVQTKPADPEDDLLYTTVHFYYNKNQEDALYSNIGAVQLHRHKNEEDEDEDNVEYSVVNCKGATASTGLRHREAEEDASALYSTVNKKH